MKTIDQLITMKSSLFFVPDDINHATKRVMEIANNSNDPASVYMAIQVLINGVANQLQKELDDEQI